MPATLFQADNALSLHPPTQTCDSGEAIEYLNLLLDSKVIKILDHILTQARHPSPPCAAFSSNPSPAANGATNLAKDPWRRPSTLEGLDVQIHEFHWLPIDTPMDPSDSDSDIVALDGPTNYADNDVDGMILATARAHPEATRKFLVRTPALMAKQAKNQQQKERRAEKAAAKRKQNDAEADDDDEPKAKKAKGKAKKDLDDPPPSITYYINIPKPPPLTKKRGAKAADDDCLQKGPFSLPTSESYSTLLSSMAAELPCRKENINESKITWKPKKPKNG
ncbi:hypothetical protein B0H13DRAFT_2519235, partial [Mycena leptocephala]